MDFPSPPTWIAFDRSTRIAFGPPREVAAKVKAFVDKDVRASVFILDALTSQTVDLDLRGTPAAVLKRLPREPGTLAALPLERSTQAPKGPGRPRLGVVAREVTLLPRHWEWLASQPGGASVALRKLVELASRTSQPADALRFSREAAYRFMSAMAGNEPGFEEATRSLFHGDIEGAGKCMNGWPTDVRQHALRLLEATRAHLQAAQPTR